MVNQFQNRTEAGELLARRLIKYADRPDVIVLALPRGGVPVGYEVARALHCPLDVVAVRKLGLPGHDELAMGAIATGGVRVLNHRVVEQSGVTPETIENVAARELRELERREQAYRDGLPAPDVRGKTVILVDDGIATGSTMRVAVLAVRHLEATAVIVATPVAAPDAAEAMGPQVDEFVAVLTPTGFSAVGEWYEDFSQTSDEEVKGLLDAANVLPHTP